MSGFQHFFRRIRKFHPGMRKKFYAIVMEGIVGGGDYHAGFKIILADQAGDSRGGDHSRKGHRCASLRKARGKDRSNVRAGFASVHADKDARGRMFAMQIGAQSVSGRKQGGIVERRRAGNAANTVGTKE